MKNNNFQIENFEPRGKKTNNTDLLLSLYKPIKYLF